jgi:hypothetical protein
MPGGITPPIAVIATWPAPNYEHPVLRGWALVIVTGVLTLLSLFTVCARVWARVGLRNIGIDDWIIIITMVGNLQFGKGGPS